jgi:hypothetical protein
MCNQAPQIGTFAQLKKQGGSLGRKYKSKGKKRGWLKYLPI